MLSLLTPFTTNERRASKRERAAMNFPTVDDIKLMLGIPPADTTKDAGDPDASSTSCSPSLRTTATAILRSTTMRTASCGWTRGIAYLRLRARPIESITEVLRTDVVVDPGMYKVYSETGLLRQDGYTGGCWCWREDEDVLVRYRGGWDTGEWPADFIDVVMQLFMQRWNASGGTGSYTDATGSAGTGKIKAFTVDAVRVEYDLGGGGSSAGQSAGGGVPPELAPFAAILAKYCDLTAYGI